MANPPIPLPENNRRDYGLDGLKGILVIWVIAYHSAQAYAPSHMWWPVNKNGESMLLGAFSLVSLSAMGIFFLASGYVLPIAAARHGGSRYLIGRTVKLGSVLLAFGLLVFPGVAYLIQGENLPLHDFIRHLHSRGWFDLYYHLWFAAHLLVYTFVYAGFDLLTSGLQTGGAPRPGRPPKWLLPACMILLAGVYWLVRLKYPMGRWVLIGIVTGEPAHMPAYIGLFILGITAQRRNWLRRAGRKTGLFWLCVGSLGMLVGSAVFYALGPDRVFANMLGGPGWPSLAYSIWEAITGLSLAVGGLTLAVNWRSYPPGRSLQAIFDCTYGAYIYHMIYVFVLQLAFYYVDAPPGLRFAAVFLLSVVLAYLTAYMLRKRPSRR